MKEEIIKLYKEFLFEFKMHEEQLWDKGGTWSKKPDFKEFMFWLEKGYIDY